MVQELPDVSQYQDLNNAEAANLTIQASCNCHVPALCKIVECPCNVNDTWLEKMQASKHLQDAYLGLVDEQLTAGKISPDMVRTWSSAQLICNPEA